MTTERALPRTVHVTVYRPAESSRSSRLYAPVVHAVKTDRVKIGNDYHGQPVMTSYTAHKSLCGTAVRPVRGMAEAEPAALADIVTCTRCARELRKLDAS